MARSRLMAPGPTRNAPSASTKRPICASTRFCCSAPRANAPCDLMIGRLVITNSAAKIRDISSPQTRLNNPSSTHAPPTSWIPATAHAISVGNGMRARSTNSANVYKPRWVSGASGLASALGRSVMTGAGAMGFDGVFGVACAALLAGAVAAAGVTPGCGVAVLAESSMPLAPGRGAGGAAGFCHSGDSNASNPRTAPSATSDFLGSGSVMPRTPSSRNRCAS